MPTLRDELAAWHERAMRGAHDGRAEVAVERIGTVARVGDGVATVLGLPDARLEELLRFPGGVLGMALSLQDDSIGCVLLGGAAQVSAGDSVGGTGEVVRVPVGESLLGRMVDPVGRPLDGGGPVGATRREPIHRAAPGIADRAPVTRQLYTGILSIDAALPLGRGQRELIVGDRNTGKTAIAVDTMISQRHSDVICVYCAIGQKASTVAQVVDAVRAHGALSRCIFVVAEADAEPGLQWLAPYTACTIGEYFRDRGRDALVIYDDLSKHAAIYRQLSLLLHTPPGREAYPGDIFYIHARLLERAAQLSDALGGGSLTALPIAETQGGNLTAYIPTNLVSITDGQIVLDPKLFHAGQKPAVDMGLSVSRVGGKTQPRSLAKLAERLRLEYAQFLELEIFTRFGGMADERSREVIDRGQRIRALLAQPQYAPLRLSVQVAMLLALELGILARTPLETIAAMDAARLEPELRARCGSAMSRIDASGALSDEDRQSLADALAAILAPEEQSQ